MLAEAVVDYPVPAEAMAIDVRLERVPLMYDATLQGRAWKTWLGDPFTLGGAHLLYVESGEITLTVGGGSQVLTRGGEALVPPGENYELRATAGCASLLRLAVAVNPGGRGAWGQGPGPRTSLCGAPRLLFTRTDPWPGEPLMEPPLRLFVSRLTWEAINYVPGAGGMSEPHIHPGPVGVVVESGELMVAVGNGQAFTTALGGEEAFGSEQSESLLPLGGAVTVQHGTRHGEWSTANRTTALFAGAVTADEALWTSPEA